MNILWLTLVQQDYLKRDEVTPVYINAEKVIAFFPTKLRRIRKHENGNAQYERREGSNIDQAIYDFIPCTLITIGVGTTEDTATYHVNETCDHILQQLPSDS